MMTVTYAAGTAIYVNMTNRCPCACTFCLRHNKDHVFNSDSLWLDREPTVDEVCNSLNAWDLTKYSEIVFCGYGEPSVRLETVRSVALKIKEKYPNIKIRINTNGQSDLIYKCDTAPMYKDAFDVVSISLNAPTAERYQEICHSVFGEEVLEKILEFAKNVNKYVQNVTFSVVKESLSEEEIEKCYEIARETGVNLRVRDLIT
jgi:TatD family-associated radical SAM protein